MLFFPAPPSHLFWEPREDDLSFSTLHTPETMSAMAGNQEVLVRGETISFVREDAHEYDTSM